MKGHIYILTHPEKPGYVKVGMTSRPPKKRLLEHNQNGALGGFAKVTGKNWKLFAHAPVTDIHRAEKWMHSRLGRRLNGLELFHVAPLNAEKILNDCPFLVDVKPEPERPVQQRGQVHMHKLKELLEQQNAIERSKQHLARHEAEKQKQVVPGRSLKVYTPAERTNFFANILIIFGLIGIILYYFSNY